MRVLSGILLGAVLTLGAARARDNCPYDMSVNERAACAFASSGAQTAESLVAQNRQFLRILYGRNADTLVLELLRGRPGPAIIILRDPAGRLPPVVTQFPDQQWLAFMKRWETLTEDNVVVRKLLDAKRVNDEASGIEMICLHAPYVVMQAALEDGPTARDGDGCLDPVFIEFAYDIAGAALTAEPDCTLLDEEHFGALPGRLVNCLKLSGNRKLAAQAFNRAAHFEADLGNIADFLAPGGVITIAGRRFVAGASAMQQAWADLTKAARYPFVVIDSVRGSAASAMLSGSINRSLGDSSGRYEHASWQEEWRVQQDGALKLVRLNVGTFHPSGD